MIFSGTINAITDHNAPKVADNNICKYVAANLQIFFVIQSTIKSIIKLITKNSSRYYADFTKCKKQIKNLQKSVDKSPRRKYNNTCKQRSYTNNKSSCGSFCFKRDCKSSAVSAKVQRGADRIFSDPFQEKSGTAAVRKLPIERGGYQWISYPR